ncbi:MAG: cytochrome c biogenesis protein CcsA [Deltaproteobacteria bacterium]|jgi:cytochrome c-type biogenesis protein CcsB|nr:cytochrome c biogenesis protein CcsA [Deltaproteobacteria bacterium]
MESLFLVIATLCYLSGTVGYLIYLLKDREVLPRIAWTILLVGVLFHGTALAMRGIGTGHFPVTSMREAISLFAWIFVVTYLIIQIKLQLRILGSFVSPLAVIFMISSRLLPTQGILKSGSFRSGWLIAHVTSIFLANALFAVLFSLGVMYLLQERRIKKKNFGLLYERLPSLERIDSIAHVCLMSGFPLMTAGLITGFVYASMVWSSPWNWDPMEVLSLVTWMIYAVLVHERLAVGWRGRRAAWLAIVGFSATVLTFVLASLLLAGHHSIISGNLYG